MRHIVLLQQLLARITNLPLTATTNMCHRQRYDLAAPVVRAYKCGRKLYCLIGPHSLANINRLDDDVMLCSAKYITVIVFCLYVIHERTRVCLVTHTYTYTCTYTFMRTLLKAKSEILAWLGTRRQWLPALSYSPQRPMKTGTAVYSQLH